MNRNTPGTWTFSASEHAPDGDGRVMRVVSKGCVYEIRFDEEDLEIVQAHTWCIYHAKCGTKYALTNVQGAKHKVPPLHRLILNPPSDVMVDHINGNGLDNRRKNLRLCTHTENMFNKRVYRNNATGFKGVTLAHKDVAGNQRYRATIQVRRCEFSLGCFGSPEEAARAYDRAAIEHFGEFAKLNFPREDYE